MLDMKGTTKLDSSTRGLRTGKEGLGGCEKRKTVKRARRLSPQLATNKKNSTGGLERRRGEKGGRGQGGMTVHGEQQAHMLSVSEYRAHGDIQWIDLNAQQNKAELFFQRWRGRAWN